MIDRTALFTALLFCTSPAGASNSARADEDRRFEVMHFWTNGAEQKALNIIRDAFTRRHSARWIDSGLPSYDEVRQQILQRIVDGYPPDAVLWHPGPEVRRLHDMELIHTLTGPAHAQRWRDRLPRAVLDTIRDGDEFVAVPTSVHGESLVWYSTKVYKKLGLDYPASWEQLIKQAAVIERAGYIGVAIGEPDWEKRVLYSVILNSLNPRAYLELFTQGTLSLTGRAEVLEAFRIMAALRDTSRTDIPQRSWAHASRLVGRGQAGMLFTGDWVGEIFKEQGWTLGADYECRPVPGDGRAYMIVVDGFILPVSADAKKPSLRREFAEVVLDPQVQVEFALAKGAVPAVKGLSDPRFDQCSRFTLEALREDDKLTPSSASLSTSTYANAVQVTAARLWQSDISAEQALDMLREELALVHEFENTP